MTLVSNSIGEQESSNFRKSINLTLVLGTEKTSVGTEFSCNEQNSRGGACRMITIHPLKVPFFTLRNARLAHTKSIANTVKIWMIRWVGLGLEVMLKVGEQPVELLEVFTIRILRRLPGGDVPQKRPK